MPKKSCPFSLGGDSIKNGQDLLEIYAFYLLCTGLDDIIYGTKVLHDLQKLKITSSYAGERMNVLHLCTGLNILRLSLCSDAV